MSLSRSMLTAEYIAARLRTDLGHALTPNGVIRLCDPYASTITRDMLHNAARRAVKPWVEHLNDCDKQAVALAHECHRRAARETMPWAVGFLRAAQIRRTHGRPSPRTDHVFTWLFEGAGDLIIYDQTNGTWHAPQEMAAVDFIFG